MHKPPFISGCPVRYLSAKGGGWVGVCMSVEGGGRTSLSTSVLAQSVGGTCNCTGAKGQHNTLHSCAYLPDDCICAS